MQGRLTADLPATINLISAAPAPDRILVSRP
jgi:hypothetical protein